MNVNGTDVAIGTATDLYYDVTDRIEWEDGSGLVTITNTGDNILSLTNLKVTHTAAPSSDLLLTIDRNTAYLAYETAMKAVALKQTDVFMPKLNVILNKTVVRVGDKVNVTVTAPADVTGITVNGTTAEQGKANKKTGFVTWSASFTVETDADCAVQVVAENGIGSKSRADEVLEHNENAES